LNALVAARAVIIPVQTHYFALEGAKQLLDSISLVRQHSNTQLETLGIVATLYDERAGIDQEVLKGLREYFKQGIFSTTIKFDAQFPEASSKGEPITVYAPGSQGAQDYSALAKEVMVYAGFQ
ncbi:MAG: ParA family protein, partial [Candidatus Omnitrophota bacterium]